MRLTIEGRWPGRLTIRQGWSRAQARPWNDDILDASMHVVRGGARFIDHASARLLDEYSPAVLSPPLPRGAGSSWRQAGFQPYLTLDLYRRDLEQALAKPALDIHPTSNPNWSELAALDRGAFDELWRMGALGLAEAHAAASKSTVLIAQTEGGAAGYSIAGVGATIGYLQRIAVGPEAQGRGVGRSLVRAAMLWMRGRGAHTCLLNTQPDNAAATSLYRSEGFISDQSRLDVLRRRSNVI